MIKRLFGLRWLPFDLAVGGEWAAGDDDGGLAALDGPVNLSGTLPGEREVANLVDLGVPGS